MDYGIKQTQSSMPLKIDTTMTKHLDLVLWMQNQDCNYNTSALRTLNRHCNCVWKEVSNVVSWYLHSAGYFGEDFLGQIDKK